MNQWKFVDSGNLGVAGGVPLRTEDTTSSIQPVNDTDGWMPIDVFLKKYDQRRNTVHKRIADGIWPRGVIYSVPDGGVGWIHEERAVRWLKEKGKLSVQM